MVFLFSDVAAAGELEPVGEAPIPLYNPESPGKVELGKKLFYDRRLSGDGTMSCATCHDPEQGFSDGLDISLSYPTTKNWRNSPTLINVGFNRFLFHDGRATSLEEQALFPIMSAFEMNQNLDYLEEELREVPGYVASFREVFGGEITRERVAMALAAFQRTLVSRNSPLDRHLGGEKDALTGDAFEGLKIFKGKGKCIKCHHGPNLTDHGFHALNVPENPKLKDPRLAITRRFVGKVSGYDDYRSLNEDPGRYLVTKDLEDWRAFRTPTLRDISRTAPYMHNGVFGTLEEVLDFLNSAEFRGLESPLGLTDREKGYLKAFLTEALTGEDIVIEFPDIPPGTE
jgi:cytochrome c peroxidase